MSIGLLLAYLDGIPVDAILRTAILASALFVVYVLAEAAWLRYRKWDRS